ncbi:hypothetical protein SH139x_001013 [Planctomycetaceae bacterium SH139]
MSAVPKSYVTPEDCLHRERKAEFRSKYYRGEMFDHYRTITSLMHYVLIAQDRHSIDLFTRNPDGSWRLTSCQGSEGKVELASIDSHLVETEVYDKVVCTK